MTDTAPHDLDPAVLEHLDMVPIRALAGPVVGWRCEVCDGRMIAQDTPSGPIERARVAALLTDAAASHRAACSSPTAS